MMHPGRMPAVFLAHGNPLRTIGPNRYTESWQRLGEIVPRPQAVLCISAHWYGHGSAVTAHPQPRTIHDFGGFPETLYRIEYPAPGDPALAERVRELLSPVEVGLDRGWGLDHGAWAVLRHVYPAADVPVVQLRIDALQPAAVHYRLGQALLPLRDEGVLILGSGNIVHNLQRFDGRHADATPYRWATQFNDRVRELIERGEHESLIERDRLGEAATLAVPTPDHYLPLLYVVGLEQPEESVSFATDVIEHASVSMLSVALGLSLPFDWDPADHRRDRHRRSAHSA